MLKHTCKLHAQKFNEVVDNVLDKIKIKKRVLQLNHSNSYEVFNAIDNVFAEIPNEARAAIEGLKRALPSSQYKLERSNQHLCWALQVKQLQGKKINAERMNRRIDLGNTRDTTSTIKEAKDKLKKPKRDRKSLN